MKQRETAVYTLENTGPSPRMNITKKKGKTERKRKKRTNKRKMESRKGEKRKNGENKCKSGAGRVINAEEK